MVSANKEHKRDIIMRFGSWKNYNEYVAKENGYKNFKEYKDEMAKRRGFKNHNELIKKLYSPKIKDNHAKKRGFVNYEHMSQIRSVEEESFKKFGLELKEEKIKFMEKQRKEFEKRRKSYYEIMERTMKNGRPHKLKYTKRQIEFLKECEKSNIIGIDLGKKFNDKFGTNKKSHALYNLMRREGIRPLYT